jgi:hypothetical protein
MKNYLLSFSTVCLLSCNNQIKEIKRSNTQGKLYALTQGSWGNDGVPILDFQPDSLFYYSENKSYYYFVHNDKLIVLYKNGPYSIENIKLLNDTLFAEIGGIDAAMVKTKSTRSNNSETKGLTTTSYMGSNDNLPKNILGKWAYKYEKGFFSWEFIKDSIYYITLNKKYFCKSHDKDIIILSEKGPTIMKNIEVKNDTMFFTTEDNIFIKSYKLK